MSGLLQTFDVSSDTLSQLEAAISITLPWHSRGAKGYRVGKTESGFSWLELSAIVEKDFLPLPYPLDSLPKMFSFVKDWLSSAERGREFDTDGSCSEGWRVTNPDMDNIWEPAFIRIEATWIVYGK